MTAAVAAVEAMVFESTTWADQRPVAELAALAAEVTRGEWWLAIGAPTVHVEPARRSARSSTARRRAGAVLVRLAPGQHDRATLAHELAHALAGIEAAHGPAFRRALADVVAALGGDGRVVAERFRRHGLAVGERSWAVPWRWSGDGFVIR